MTMQVLSDRLRKASPQTAGLIVHALGWYFPEALGGMEVYVAGLCRQLQAAGHEVRVAAPSPGASGGREYDYHGVPVFRYPIPRNPTRDECRGTALVRGTGEFHRWLGEVRPDIVHFHIFSTGLGPAEVAAARECGARVFATTHLPALGYLCQRGTMLRWGEEPCDGVCRPAKCAACSLHQRGLSKSLAWTVAGIPVAASGLLGRVPGRSGTMLGMKAQIQSNRRMQDDILRNVEKFVVLTQWAHDAMIRNGAPPEKVVLNRLGHGHAAACRKPSPEESPTRRPIRIGFVGRLDPLKGADVLARAVASLSRSVEFTLEICGPASGTGNGVETQIRSILGDDPRVAFRGPVPPEEIPELLAGYDVLAVPSVCLEGGPTVAIEAHAVGTPVIGSRMGGLAELVTDGVNGRLVPPKDAAALADVIRAMATDPAATIDRWRTALPAARTMDDVTRDYLTYYEQVPNRCHAGDRIAGREMQSTSVSTQCSVPGARSSTSDSGQPR